jgi:hypothetical protein
MTAARCSDPEFIEMFESVGPAGIAAQLGVSVRSVYKRREVLEKKYGRQITAPVDTGGGPRTRFHINHPERYHIDIQNGTVLIGSDQHYWPGIVTAAHRGFVKFAKELKPAAIVLNGDVFDGASVSRHPSIGWENKPSVIQEIEAVQERTGEIIDAAPKAKRIWALGNHDARFETRLANVAPQYAKVHGVHLRDHFPLWEPCWSAWLNNDCVVKHRFKGGIHAAFNNALWSGKSMVTGHLHKGVVTPFSDYNGTRYAVDLPTMADPFGPQFVDYTEDSPRNHRSGFAVITFHKGKMLQPQMALVTDDGTIDFERKVYDV